MKNNKILSLIIAIILPCVVFGQNLTSNPFSMFGFGELDRATYGYFGGMGGVGIGMKQFNTINNSNPASLSSILKQSFVLESSVMGKYSLFSAGRANGTENSVNGNIERIAMAFRTSDRVAIGLSLTPFTKIGYNIRKTNPIEGSNDVEEVHFLGSGGLNRINMSTGINILPSLSLGINASLIFGNLTQDENSSSWNIQTNSRTSRINFDFGLQYSFNSNEKQITLGMVGGLKSSLTMHNSIKVINSDDKIVEDKGLLNTVMNVPMFLGVGIGVEKGTKLYWGVDYRFQKWSETVNKNNSYYKYCDTHNFKVGVSYTPNATDVRNYLKRVTYQMGLNISNSYIELNGYSPIEYGISVGAIMPLKQTLNSVGRFTINLEYGKMGSRKEDFFREDFIKLSFGFTFAESWFVRHKFK
jgi:hypothetical protein